MKKCHAKKIIFGKMTSWNLAILYGHCILDSSFFSSMITLYSLCVCVGGGGGGGGGE